MGAMRTSVRHLWSVLTTGYWFIPALLMIGAIGLSVAVLYVDQRLIRREEPPQWLYAGSADGAKVLLSTIAGSIITVAGVVFSITIAALTQASQQFGPRLLRNFMRDTGNQIVLGTFVATFLYCLLVLRRVHEGTEIQPAFVPHLSVTVAVLLSIASIAVLIYFIHHVSASLQAPAVVAAVLREFLEVMHRLGEDHLGTAEITPGQSQHGHQLEKAPGARAGGPGLRDRFQRDALAVLSSRQGYLQAIDLEALTNAAAEEDLVLCLEYRPGDYLMKNGVLLRASPAARCTPKLAKRFNDAFLCGRNATSEQDVEYAIRQIVEVAVRALSPGINDPFTAINCLDALGVALCQVHRTGLPGPLRYDGSGRLRLVLRVTTLEGVIDAAFDQIRQYGRGSVAVQAHLLEVIATCARHMTQPQPRRALLRHADMVHRQCERTFDEPLDLQDLRRRWETVANLINGTAE